MSAETSELLRNRIDDLETALLNLLNAKDATADYMRRIPDGCSAEPGHLGRLTRRETAAEDAARLVLNSKR